MANFNEIEEARILLALGEAASEYLALEMVRNEQMFNGAINRKYADEYLVML